MKKYTGRLTELYTLDTEGREFDPTDIALECNKEFEGYPAVWLDKAYIGIRNRAEFLIIGALVSTNIASDHVASGAGNVSIDTAIMEDTLPYLYTRKNHKDLFQFYNYCNTTHKLLDTPISGVHIKNLTAIIRGNDKVVLQNTETCGYNNFVLFEEGVTVSSDNPEQFLINTMNAVDWVIGSPAYPVDPLLISNAIIRILGVKKGSKPSHNITIHARPNLRLQLDDSAKAALTLLEYPYL